MYLSELHSGVSDSLIPLNVALKIIYFLFTKSKNLNLIKSSTPSGKSSLPYGCILILSTKSVLYRPTSSRHAPLSFTVAPNSGSYTCVTPGVPGFPISHTLPDPPFLLSNTCCASAGVILP